MPQVKPFTYLLKFKPTGQVYYGCRKAKNANPAEFWTTYFTSSKRVRLLMKEYGPEAFEFEIRRVFDDPVKALDWEHKVLRRMQVVHDDRWLNATDNRMNFPAVRTEEHKKKIGDAHRGRVFSDVHVANLKKSSVGKGKDVVRSVEHRANISNGRKGIVFSEEHKAKLASAKIGTKSSAESNLKRSEKLKGRTSPTIGKKWYNDGKMSGVFSIDNVPNGWVPGRIGWKKDK